MSSNTSKKDDKSDYNFPDGDRDLRNAKLIREGSIQPTLFALYRANTRH
jgi:hypothetical protein